MTTYQDIDWNSINYLRAHLYRRLASPLNGALGRLALAQHLQDEQAVNDQLQRTEHNLELTLNLIRAWAALTHVMMGATIQDQQRRLVGPDAMPPWLLSHLNAQTGFQVEHTQPVFVHAPAYFESLVLLCQLAATVGNLKHLRTCDGPDSRPGVWMRAVFEAPTEGPYANLHQLQAHYAANEDVLFQLHVLKSLLAINGAQFVLQNHRETGEQALVARLPASQLAASEIADHGLHMAAESADQPPAREPLIDSAAEAQDTDEPHLSGPVLARTPRDLVTGTPTSGLVSLDGAPHRSGPVLAALGAPAAPAGEEIENRSETLITPPPGFEERLAEALRAEGTLDEAEPENRSQTLIVPPVGFKDRLVRHSQEADAVDSAPSAEGASSQGGEPTESGTQSEDSPAHKE